MTFRITNTEHVYGQAVIGAWWLPDECDLLAARAGLVTVAGDVSVGPGASLGEQGAPVLEDGGAGAAGDRGRVTWDQQDIQGWTWEHVIGRTRLYI